jgi:hypothetical protein
MTLFLSPRDPATGLRWLRFCDLVQVRTLVLALELSPLYVPSLATIGNGDGCAFVPFVLDNKSRILWRILLCGVQARRNCWHCFSSAETPHN